MPTSLRTRILALEELALPGTGATAGLVARLLGSTLTPVSCALLALQARGLMGSIASPLGYRWYRIRQ